MGTDEASARMAMRPSARKVLASRNTGRKVVVPMMLEDMPDTVRGKRLEAYALIALANLDLEKAYRLLNAADEQEAGR